MSDGMCIMHFIDKSNQTEYKWLFLLEYMSPAAHFCDADTRKRSKIFVCGCDHALDRHGLGQSTPTQISTFMGPTWGAHGSCQPQMSPTLAPWTLLSGLVYPMKYVHSLPMICFVVVISWVGSGFSCVIYYILPSCFNGAMTALLPFK